MKKKDLLHGLGMLLIPVAIFIIVNLIINIVSQPSAAMAIDATSLAKIDIVSASSTDGNIIMKDASGNSYSATSSADILTALKEKNVYVTVGTQNNFYWIIGMLVAALAVISFAVFVVAKQSYIMATQSIMSMGMAGAMGMRAEPKEKSIVNDLMKKPTVRFSDIKGLDSIIDDLNRCVDCLKHTKKYKDMGVTPPKGVLLEGPPGTGKTLIAMAIAAEAGVGFISVNGADFIEKYVGVGAQRIRDLYHEAREKAPCVIFIDEIDGIGGKRSDGPNADESNRTINALLSELDGFGSKEFSGVLTICATNRSEMLDEALTRSGRFDLKLAIPLPDRKARKEILELNISNKVLDAGIDIENLAAKTFGFSGADIYTLVNEAGMIAVGSNRTSISANDVDDAFFKIVMKGSKKKNEGEVRNLCAYHEAGHAVANILLAGERVSGVTIIGSMSGAGGVTFLMSEDEKMIPSKRKIENMICVDYAGRAAEELAFGKENITGGASSDIEHATKRIKAMLYTYGMGNNGLLDIKKFDCRIDDIEEASKCAVNLYEKTLSFLKANRVILDAVAQALLEKDTLSETELNAILNEFKISKLEPIAIA